MEQHENGLQLTYTRVECSVFAPVAIDTQETPQNSGVTSDCLQGDLLL